MADMAYQKSYPKSGPKKAAFRGKIKTIMGEFKDRTLHSGSARGPKVTDRKQAVAIALSQARRTILGKH